MTDRITQAVTHPGHPLTRWRWLLWLAISLPSVVPVAAQDGPPPCTAASSDFDDGSLQGWTAGDNCIGGPLGGRLLLGTAGNPGGCLEAYDDFPGRGGLCALAPVDFTGDLSSHLGLAWDQWLSSGAVASTSIHIRSAGGTVFRCDSTVRRSRTWDPRFVSFDRSEWSLREGDESFDQVISDVDALAIQMDVTTGRGLESRIDNIRLLIDCEHAPTLFSRGDANADSQLDVSDAVAILQLLFESASEPVTCHKAADSDDNGLLEITDAVYLLRYLFSRGRPLPEPLRDCGRDATRDELSCELHDRCGS